MSYVMRLSDGRFIVVDGGYIEANNEESKRLYALMEQQNVLDKITSFVDSHTGTKVE